MADVASAFSSWSTTLGSNNPTDSTTIGANLADNFQQIQSTLRSEIGTRGTIASAATVDLSTKSEGTLDVTGTTTITAFGTVSAGIRKRLVFADALTLTYNATSLKLPTSANLTTSAGDWCEVISLGSGNWEMLWYTRKDGRQISGTVSFGDGTVSLPSMTFTSDTDNGFYRIGANNWAGSCAGTKIIDFSSGAMAVTGTLSVSSSAVVSGAFTAGPSTAFRIEADGSLNYTAPAASGTVQISAAANLLEIYGHTTGGGRLSMASTSVNLYTGGVAGSFVANDTGGSWAFVNANVGGTALRWTAATGQLCVVEAIGVPTITSGSGTPAGTIAGTDQAFRVTMGTTPGTSLVIAFAHTWANAPMVHPKLQANVACWVSAVSTTSVTITFASAPSTSAVLDVWCIGYQTS